MSITTKGRSQPRFEYDSDTASTNAKLRENNKDLAAKLEERNAELRNAREIIANLKKAALAQSGLSEDDIEEMVEDRLQKRLAEIIQNVKSHLGMVVSAANHVQSLMDLCSGGRLSRDQVSSHAHTNSSQIGRESADSESVLNAGSGSATCRSNNDSISSSALCDSQNIHMVNGRKLCRAQRVPVTETTEEGEGEVEGESDAETSDSGMSDDQTGRSSITDGGTLRREKPSGQKSLSVIIEQSDVEAMNTTSAINETSLYCKNVDSNGQILTRDKLLRTPVEITVRVTEDAVTIQEAADVVPTRREYHTFFSFDQVGSEYKNAAGKNDGVVTGRHNIVADAITSTNTSNESNFSVQEENCGKDIVTDLAQAESHQNVQLAAARLSKNIEKQSFKCNARRQTVNCSRARLLGLPGIEDDVNDLRNEELSFLLPLSDEDLHPKLSDNPSQSHPADNNERNRSKRADRQSHSVKVGPVRGGSEVLSNGAGCSSTSGASALSSCPSELTVCDAVEDKTVRRNTKVMLNRKSNASVQEQPSTSTADNLMPGLDSMITKKARKDLGKAEVDAVKERCGKSSTEPRVDMIAATCAGSDRNLAVAKRKRVHASTNTRAEVDTDTTDEPLLPDVTESKVKSKTKKNSGKQKANQTKEKSVNPSCNSDIENVKVEVRQPVSDLSDHLVVPGAVIQRKTGDRKSNKKKDSGIVMDIKQEENSTEFVSVLNLPGTSSASGVSTSRKKSDNKKESRSKRSRSTAVSDKEPSLETKLRCGDEHASSVYEGSPVKKQSRTSRKDTSVKTPGRKVLSDIHMN